MYIGLDDLVPQDRLLRGIRKNVDFTLVYEKVQHLYSPFGHRSRRGTCCTFPARLDHLSTCFTF